MVCFLKESEQRFETMKRNIVNVLWKNHIRHAALLK